MKTLIVAAMAAAVSLTAISATSVPSQAASVYITTDDNMRHDDRYWRYHHREREHWRYWKHARKCRVKVEKRWRHGHLVVREVKVCRFNNGW